MIVRQNAESLLSEKSSIREHIEAAKKVLFEYFGKKGIGNPQYKNSIYTILFKFKLHIYINYYNFHLPKPDLY